MNGQQATATDPNQLPQRTWLPWVLASFTLAPRMAVNTAASFYTPSQLPRPQPLK